MRIEKGMRKVVTWQSPRGYQVDLCNKCADKFKADKAWPRDELGEEYCTVSHGRHYGWCSFCSEEAI